LHPSSTSLVRPHALTPTQPKRCLVATKLRLSDNQMDFTHFYRLHFVSPPCRQRRTRQDCKSEPQAHPPRGAGHLPRDLHWRYVTRLCCSAPLYAVDFCLFTLTAPDLSPSSVHPSTGVADRVAQADQEQEQE
jgi:hypothetical protein